MFCFTNILNIFFSFVTCSMHKNSHQNAGNGIKETIFQNFPGEHARTPLEVFAPSARVGQIRVRLPKISKPERLCSSVYIYSFLIFVVPCLLDVFNVTCMYVAAQTS